MQARKREIGTSSYKSELEIEYPLCDKKKLTTDSSSGGWRPWFSACPAIILRATGSLFPKYLSCIFCFDSSFFTGISCLNTVREGGDTWTTLLHTKARRLLI